nr:immunoglobulin heavy chain junction region [Macaca mulatta]MOV41109.1 immunoglobulin heavy chain junction region [Macaca mulatta]MOV44385.1 immunoglobulin heavy chain junction region [Macaca mulatta]
CARGRYYNIYTGFEGDYFDSW